MNDGITRTPKGEPTMNIIMNRFDEELKRQDDLILKINEKVMTLDRSHLNDKISEGNEKKNPPETIVSKLHDRIDILQSFNKRICAIFDQLDSMV